MWAHCLSCLAAQTSLVQQGLPRAGSESDGLCDTRHCRARHPSQGGCGPVQLMSWWAVPSARLSIKPDVPQAGICGPYPGHR